jgi:phosphate-selective porin OprO and OprP
MTFKHRFVCGVAFGVAASGPVRAQTQAPVSTQIEQLQQQMLQMQQQHQQQMQQMQQQLQALQNQVNAAQTPPPAAAAATASVAAAPHVTQSQANRFGLESADGQYSIGLTGRLQLDVGDYADYNPGSKFASTQDLNSGVNARRARRARLGVVGKFAGDWNYTFIYDLGGSSDGLPPAAGAPSSGINNAYVSYVGLNKGPLPLAFDIGYLDTPFTLDEATSSNDIMFLERASIQSVATSIAAGDARSAAGVRSNSDRYWAGIYLTGPASGAAHGIGEQTGAFGRFTYQLLQTPDYSLHFGVDAEGLAKPPDVGGIRTITLSDRPELRVDPTAILSTGALGTATNPVDSAAVYGFEVAGGYRNLFAQGEYYHIDVDRQGLPTNNFDGAYIEGSWTVTGEHRTYLPATGAYSAIVPAHPFSLSSGYWGALELAARYSEVDLNDNFESGVAPGTSNAVGGGRQTVYSLGLNWYPNANMRFMLDYLHGTIDKGFSAAAGGGIAGTPLGAEVGGNFDAIALRTQVAF